MEKEGETNETEEKNMSLVSHRELDLEKSPVEEESVPMTITRKLKAKSLFNLC